MAAPPREGGTAQNGKPRRGQPDCLGINEQAVGGRMTASAMKLRRAVKEATLIPKEQRARSSSTRRDAITLYKEILFTESEVDARIAAMAVDITRM